MASRVEQYMHSDAVTANKGGAMARVYCQTDFATRAEIFILFCKKVAMYAFAANDVQWTAIIAEYPHLEEERLALEAKKTGLGEKVWVGEICVFREEDYCYFAEKQDAFPPAQPL